MELKQISLTMPKNLYDESKKYSEEFGYRNLQEFVVDLIRKKIILENLERYVSIEANMKRGIGVKKFDQKGALKYIEEL